jgi:hypothetical protein
MKEISEYSNEDLDKSIKLHISIISFYKDINLVGLPEYDRQVIIDTIRYEETWLNRLDEERRRRNLS